MVKSLPGSVCTKNIMVLKHSLSQGVVNSRMHVFWSFRRETGLNSRGRSFCGKRTVQICHGYGGYNDCDSMRDDAALQEEILENG